MKEKNYEINDETLAIIPENLDKSIILEEDYQYEIEKNPLEVVNHSCKYFGSSYKGRKEGSREILFSSYKLPILIEDSQNLIFLPTESPESQECIWLALNKIKKLEKIEEEKSKTMIEFYNGQKIMINISYSSIKNQILRASRLESILRNRKAIKKQ